MSSVTISITRKQPETLPYKWAVVKHDPNRQEHPDAEDFPPDAITLQDRSFGKLLGHPIPVLPAVWAYLRRINDDRAWRWLTTYEAMWINNNGVGGEIDITKRVNAECIIGGGNLIAYDAESATHLRIVCRPYTFDFGTLDHTQDNFATKPWLYWYPTCISGSGIIRKIGSGRDVYIPLIAYTELWIAKSKINLLSKKPDKWTIENVLS